jgi:hypothetical protein
MGNIIARIKLITGILRDLNAEYHTFRERLHRSPGLPVKHPTRSFWMVPPATLPVSSEAALPSHVDILVIGSGITSASCIRTLLSKGPPNLRILVLEARDVCSGATGR